MIEFNNGRLFYHYHNRLAEPVNLQELGYRCCYRSTRMADALSVSRRQLERYFDSRLGLSPKQWLSEQRMLKALELIRSGYGLKETAHRLGFKKYDNFRVEVKRHFGLTPFGLVQEHKKHRALL